MPKISINISLKKKISLLLLVMKLIWHNYYITCIEFYQVVLRGKRKLDLSKVEFYRLFNLNP